MTSPILRYFQFSHLPVHLAAVSSPLALLAQEYDETLPDGPEKSAGLRKLLEAKDCFVRAALDKVELDKAADRLKEHAAPLAADRQRLDRRETLRKPAPDPA